MTNSCVIYVTTIDKKQTSDKSIVDKFLRVNLISSELLKATTKTHYFYASSNLHICIRLDVGYNFVL